MEAAGIDVFIPAINIGCKLSTIPYKNWEYGGILHSLITSVGLIQVE